MKDLIRDYDDEALRNQKRGAEARRVLNDLERAFDDRSAAELTRRELLEELIRPKPAVARENDERLEEDGSPTVRGKVRGRHRGDMGKRLITQRARTCFS